MQNQTETRTVVLSLKERWADEIYSGRKTIEVRRRFPISQKMPQRALIYTSSPVKAITGEVSIFAVQKLPLIKILKSWIDQTRVSREELEAYLGDLGHGTLVFMDQVKRYDSSIPLDHLRKRHGFTAPQSFAYAQPGLLAEID